MNQMKYFVDTSALFKRYVPQEGSDFMDRLFEQENSIIISSLTRIELASNLQRLLSVDRAINRSQFHDTWASFSLDLARGRLAVVGVVPEVLDGALHLLSHVYATPVDALQISTAVSLGSGVSVVSSDRKLNKMLREARLNVIDPVSPPAENCFFT